jgi:hypothetical protein
MATGMQSARSRRGLREGLLAVLFIQLAMAVSWGSLFPIEPAFTTEARLAPAGIAERLGVSVETIRHRLFVEEVNSGVADSTAYMIMAAGGEARPPYAFRPVVPALAGAVAGLAADPVADRDGFMLALFPAISTLNILFLLGTALLLRRIVLKAGGDEAVALAAAALAVANVGTIQTAPFMMVDVATYFCAALAVSLFQARQALALGLALAASVAVKEIMIVFAALLCAMALERRALGPLLLTVLPAAVFVGLRLAHGTDPLSVQYDWRISEGEIRLDLLRAHLSHLDFPISVALAIGGPLAAALLLAPRAPRAEAAAGLAIVAAVIMANLLLASRVPRIVFVLYPVLVLMAVSGLARMRADGETARPG